MLGVAVLLNIVLSAVNGWRETKEWSVGARLLQIGATMVPVFALFRWVIAERDEGHAAWVERARKLDPKLQPPSPRPFSESIRWPLGFAIPGLILGTLLLNDPALGPVLGVLSFLTLPFAGGILGLHLSPEHRDERAFNQRVAEVHRLARRDEEERYREDRLGGDPRRTQAEWRQRAYEALTWWSIEGARLNSDPAYLEAMVRGGRSRNCPPLEEALARYRNPDDPCATKERALHVATWIVATLPDLLAEHATRGEERTAGGLTQILRLHHRRDIFLHEETNEYFMRRTIEKIAEESPEGLVARLLNQYGSVVRARLEAARRIEDLARRYPAAEREDFIRRATNGVDAMLNRWMEKRATEV